MFEGAPGDAQVLLITLRGEKVLCNISRSRGAHSTRRHNLDLLRYYLSDFREIYVHGIVDTCEQFCRHSSADYVSITMFGESTLLVFLV